MTAREDIKRALYTEQRTLQRQQLLKRLWKLNEQEHASPAESESQSLRGPDREVERQPSKSPPADSTVAPVSI